MRIIKIFFGIALCFCVFSLILATEQVEKNAQPFFIAFTLLCILGAVMLFKKSKKEKVTGKKVKNLNMHSAISQKSTSNGNRTPVTTEYMPSDMPKDIVKSMRKHYTFMQAQRDAEIMNESFKLASSTSNISVFCMRHDLALQKAHTLLQAEQAGVHGIKKLNCHKACLTVINASHALKFAFLENYSQRNFEMAENLKTDNGKSNRYKKMIAELEQAEETFKDIPEYKMTLSEIELHLTVLDLSYAMRRADITKVAVASDGISGITNSQPSSFEEYQIPSDILSLLWIKGKTSSNLPGLEDEPSLIDLSLPISKGSDMRNETKLDYYPSYISLSPEQRSVYLNWLEDIRKPISIGYVFLFYYGLERHLFTDKSDDAMNTIIELRKYHQNASFNSYTSDALTVYAMTKSNDEISDKIISNLNGAAYLWLTLKLHGFLTPYDIISTYNLWGFTNKRYICGKDGLDDLFAITLEEIFMERYGESVLRIDEIESNENTQLILANYSLPHSMKEFNITDITKSTELSSCVLELLTETHERVKIKAREIRKANQL